MPLNLSRLRPGQSVKAEDWNALCAAFEDLSIPTSNNETQFVPSVGGMNLRNVTQREIWARITNRSGVRYAFQEVMVDDGANRTDQQQTNYGVIGDGTTFWAVEVAGRQDVPIGSIVRMVPSPFGAFMTFEFHGIGFAYSGAGGGLSTVKWRSLTLINGTCVLVEYVLTQGADGLTLGVNIDLPPDASGP